MRRRLLLFLFSGLILGIALPALAQTSPDFSGVQSGSSTTADPAAKKPPIVFDPEIEIPFFPTGPVDSTTFAKYIRAIFIVFIWSVGVLATVMVVYGGVRWVAAAGDAARINQAKDVVYNAIIGLVIALTSVTMLNLIDPRLVKFEGLSSTQTNLVVGIPFETDLATGKFNEAITCKTKNGNPVQQETTCFLANTQLNWPVGNVTKTMSSRVGPRNVGSYASKCHAGTDFTTNQTTGKAVLATHDGVLQAVGPNAKCGEYTMELHGNNFYTRYVHVKQPLKQTGDRVVKGQIIGYSGGNPADGAAIKNCSGGPHLHVELYSSTDEIHDIFPCIYTGASVECRDPELC